jgi:D-glucuronyl C5-epimerase C-terminus
MAIARLACGVCVALAALLSTAAAAHAAPVLTLDHKGDARLREDPFAGGGHLPDAAGPATRRVALRAPGGTSIATTAQRRRTVIGELKRLRDAGAIDPVSYADRREVYEDARGTAKRLSGARGKELTAVVRTVEAIAASGQLSASRLAPLWLTLERNRRWWTTGPLIPGGRRVEFSGSELVWQYYPGQGLQLQVLANFGKLNGLWSGGRRYTTRLGDMVDELLPLAAQRGSGLAWEYYFTFNGGKPPWVSGMAQGTAVQALARAASRLGRADIVPFAQRALGIFREPPPAGVRVEDGDGAHYLIYSFAPDLRVLNGFLQSLIGLYDFGSVTGDADAWALFAQGQRAALRETPAYDTGAWSLYSRGSVKRESDLGYHELVSDFLGGLCKRTGQSPYCVTKSHFDTYLKQPPTLALRTKRVRGGVTRKLRFALSKISSVGLQLSRRGEVVASRSGVRLGRGLHGLEVPIPRRGGTYQVRLSAVDLAGNAGSAEGTVEVVAPKKRRSRN